MGRERRVHPRYRAEMEVLLHVGGGGRVYQGRSWDLSVQGAFILMNQDVPVQARVDLTLTSADRSETLFLSGQVVHVAPGRGLGIRFSALSSRASGKLAELLARLAIEQPEEDVTAAGG